MLAPEFKHDLAYAYVVVQITEHVKQLMVNPLNTEVIKKMKLEVTGCAG